MSAKQDKQRTFWSVSYAIIKFIVVHLFRFIGFLLSKVISKGKVILSPKPKETVVFDYTIDDEKVRNKRNLAITELITSEKKYYSYLKMLVEVYQKKLSKYLTDDQNRLIFANIEPLMMLSDTLTQSFEKEYERGPEKAEIGLCFEESKHFIKLFVPYIGRYPLASQLLQELYEKKDFRKICTDLEADYEPLTSLLVMPVQRMPRYFILIKEIAKSTPANHPDSKNLENALRQLEEASQNADSKIREANNRTELFKIQQSIKKCPPLISASRRLIGTWELSTDKLEAIVLSDSVLLVERKHSALSSTISKVFRKEILLNEVSEVVKEEGCVVLVTCKDDHKFSLTDRADEMFDALKLQVREMKMLRSRCA